MESAEDSSLQNHVKLYEAIKTNDVLTITSILESHPDLITHRYEDHNTPLLIACSLPDTKVETVKVLLDHKADETAKNTQSWQALHYASSNVNYEILELILMKNCDIINDLAQGSNALQILICSGDPSSNNFIRCIEILLDKGVNINYSDRNSRESLNRRAQRKLSIDSVGETGIKSCEPYLTSLELAVKGAQIEVVLMLLKHGAKVSTHTLITCLKNINSTTCEYKTCYDELIRHIKALYLNEEIYLLVNGYNEIGNTPLHYAVRYADSDIIEDLLVLGSSLVSSNDTGKMPIEYMDPIILENHLNNCIQCNIKCQHDEMFVVRYDYLSLIPFEDIMRTGYVRKGNSRWDNRETKAIIFMSNNNQLRHLLKHPLITSYLSMVWCIQLQYAFWLNFFISLMFNASLLTYIIMDYSGLPPEYPWLSMSPYFALTLLGITLIFLYLKELFQLMADPKKYLKSVRKLTRLVTISMATVVIFTDFSISTQRQLSAITVLLISLEILFLSGQHPFFSVYLIMFNTVTLNFLKLLVWYSNPVCSFAIIFHMLLSPLNSEHTIAHNNTFFENSWRSLFKTVVMMTGEYDASNISFNNFPVTIHLFFILFIFIISIVLLNLLNGLAISDAQMIRNDAELISHSMRANYIQRIKCLVCTENLPIRLIEKMLKYLHISSTFSITRWARGTFFDENHTQTIYPNLKLFYNLIRTTNGFVFLDKSTLRRTKDIIRSRSKQGNVDLKESYKKLTFLEEKMNSLEEKTNTILQMIINK